MTNYPDAKSIGRRLTAFRLAKKFSTQAEMAKAIGRNIDNIMFGKKAEERYLSPTL